MAMMQTLPSVKISLVSTMSQKIFLTDFVQADAVRNVSCSEALIIFSIHEYTAILVKFEYFIVISLVSSNF